MSLDLRTPIGLMFAIFGIILIGYGFVSDPTLYQRSLGVNVNLAWGAVLLGFGLVMLGLATRSRSIARRNGAV